MVFNILKKDLILLWPAACLSAAVIWVLDGLLYAVDVDPALQYLRVTAQVFTAVTFLAIVFTVALGVQQDAIPGTRQDWLTRPIRRADLFLAKLLFCLLVVHLPMLAGDLVSILAHGFPLTEAIGAALRRNLNLFAVLTLPALGFAALTRNIAQFVGAGLAYFVGAVVLSVVAISVAARLAGQEQATNPVAWTGIGWISQSLGRAALAVGVIVALQLLTPAGGCCWRGSWRRPSPRSAC